MIDLVNPYHSDYDDTREAPFAGRKDAFARLHTRLFDPVRSGAILFLGGRHIGKTALLHSVDGVFKETTLSVYVPLRETALDSETEWLLALAQIMTSELVERGFTLTRLSQLDPPEGDIRAWFETTFLPQILGAARRKLLLLLDDADRLMLAVRALQLPDDTFAYLLDLAQKFQNIHFALALDTDFEDDLGDFAPLVAPNDVVRLSPLAPDETQWLLQAPTQGVYTVPDECAQAVHRAVGGAPGLVQHFGYQFFRRWETYPELNVFTQQDVKALLPTIYLFNEPDFRYLWDRLSVNEHLVLTAISGLLYSDPLGRIDAARIQAWLVETDYPLDLTAINSTLRSLEYRQLLQPSPNGIVLTAEIMQTWLLENARLDVRPPTLATHPADPDEAPATPAQRRVPTRVLLILTIILIVLVIANVVAYAWVNGGSSATTPTIQPTVTLATPPGVPINP